MRSSLLLLILAAAVTSANAGEPAPTAFDFQSRIGVAEFNDTGEGCLTIRNPGLPERGTIYLVSLQEPQKVARIDAVTRVEKSCSGNSVVPNDASFYSFRIGKEKAELVPPTIAIAGYAGSFKLSENKLRADLNNDGILESFRGCTSTEGLHLTVWAGEPLISKRLWHEYYYLGYDLEPNCTEKDYQQ